MEATARKDLLHPGEIAPDFTAQTHDGVTVRLSELHGKHGVVLVFYPGDDTPICTAQLCRFRDDWRTFQQHNILVFGVNPAPSGRHARFADKHHFPFPLLADTGGRIAALYGCRGMFGLIKRTVYGMDRHGRVVFARRGNPAPATILEAFRAAQEPVEATEEPPLSG